MIAFERALVSGTAASAAAAAEQALADGSLFIEQPVDSAHAYFATAALAMSGRLRAAESYLGEAIEQCRRRGSVRGIAFASAMRALVRHQLGELHAAEEDAQTFFELEASGDWSVFRLAASAALANVLFERGDVRGAQAVLADTRREVDHVLLLSVRGARRACHSRGGSRAPPSASSGTAASGSATGVCATRSGASGGPSPRSPMRWRARTGRHGGSRASRSRC